MTAMQVIGWMFICFIAFVFIAFAVIVIAGIVRSLRLESYKQKHSHGETKDE